ncbi:MFS transporter [Rhizobium sp. SSA_523]|uniref:MFS transporter n=1 Tax=Rhizobium sp. SSA_523 TaxID=2952477 RepID=UPI0020907F4B|nr:MFS transporter [Rhizobium sp. SSA_523]MCO5733767.1 MFS transporter [Rhizobium sp. SSA_523]WKC24957.1 MFS transporter [Rhizobium sp. SSA_523]
MMLAPPALLFFCNALLFVSLFTRLPSIQEGLGVDKAMLGLALLGAPAGTFLALPIAGRVTEALTPRRTAPLMLAIAALITPILTIVPVAGFFLCFLLFGFFRTILDVAANMISTGIEQRTGRKILSRSHGFWSVGLLVGSLISGFLAKHEVSPFHHQLGAALVVVLCCAIVLKIAPREERVSRPATGRRKVFVWPDRIILLICVMVFGIGISEGAVYDWGIFYLREVLRADAATAGILYAGFTVGMGATRMVGDRLRDRFGTMTLVRGSATVVALGVVLLLSADNLAMAALALFLMGCGVALGFPLAVATTISLGRGSMADNLAALALTLLIANIGVPPLLGFVAEHVNLKASFAVLLPFLVLSFAMAPVAQGRLPRLLRRSAETPKPGEKAATAPVSPQDAARG